MTGPHTAEIANGLPINRPDRSRNIDVHLIYSRLRPEILTTRDWVPRATLAATAQFADLGLLSNRGINKTNTLYHS